jgi:hypothetical protein
MVSVCDLDRLRNLHGYRLLCKTGVMARRESRGTVYILGVVEVRTLNHDLQ